MKGRDLGEYRRIEGIVKRIVRETKKRANGEWGAKIADSFKVKRN